MIFKKISNLFKKPRKKFEHLIIEWPMLNGEYHGIQKTWHHNGNMLSLHKQNNGDFVGLYQNWHHDSNRDIISNFLDGSACGPIIEFNYPDRCKIPNTGSTSWIIPVQF